MKIIQDIEEVKRIILQVGEVAGYLWQRGWAERNAGNISVNISHLLNTELESGLSHYKQYKLDQNFPELANMVFFVTGTGTRMRDLAKDPLTHALFIKLNDAGNAYSIFSQQEPKTVFLPTSELPTHLAIHHKLITTGSRNKVVMHTHANELVALTQIKKFTNAERLNKMLFGMHPEAIMFIPKGIGFVEYTIPGTMEIANKTVDIIDKYDVVLWEKHGVFAVGKDVVETFDMIDILAKSAKIYFMVRAAGFEPEGLTDEQLQVLKDIYT